MQVSLRGSSPCLDINSRNAADVLTDRVKAAAKRVASIFGGIAKLSDALDDLNANKGRITAQATPFEKAVTLAASALKHARAEAGAARTRLESSSRPRRVLNYLKAKWDTAPQPLDVDEAERRVGEAVRVFSSVREEADRVWDVVHDHFSEAEVVAVKLHKAKAAHTSAVAALAKLDTKLVRAKRQVRTARTIKIGQCFAGEVHAPGGGGKLGSLLVAARVTESVGNVVSIERVRSQRAEFDVQHTAD